MPRRRTPLPQQLQRRVFTTAQAGTHGIDRERLRGPDVRWVGANLFHAAAWEATEASLARALLAEVPHAVLSHVSAARWWGMPLPLTPAPQGHDGPGTASLMDSTGRVLADADPRWSDVWSSGTPVDVTVPPHGSRPRRRQLRAHRCTVPSGDVTISRGIPVTTRERTWLDLCTELPGD